MRDFFNKYTVAECFRVSNLSDDCLLWGDITICHKVYLHRGSLLQNVR